MAKQKKSKSAQRKDLSKLAAAAAAAAFVSSKGRKGKKGKGGLLFALFVFVAVFAVGSMYYFDMAPFDFDLMGDGSFKSWYTSADSFTVADGNAQIHFFDVKQGDSIFIQLPDGKTMLIDGGDNKNITHDDGSKQKIGASVVEKLTELGISKIDYVMLTHADADHSGGLDEIVASDITFSTAYIPLIKSEYANDPVVSEFNAQAAAKEIEVAYGFDQDDIQTITTNVYANFMQAVVEENADIKFNLEGTTIVGEGYRFDFYSPLMTDYSSLSSAQKRNNVSPIIILTVGQKKVLLTGDTDSAESNFYAHDDIAGSDIGDVDVLKVAHHGGSESTSEELLKVAQPEFAVIPVGEGNHYGHPTKEVLARLSGINCKVFTTMDNGDIVLSIIDNKIGWSFEKSGGVQDEFTDVDVALIDSVFKTSMGVYA